jgi:hypothetical protein
MGMLGVVLLTLGALNAGLALTVETCTQGAADSLGGGFLTFFLYVAGAWALIGSPPPRAAFLSLLPAAAIAMWHSVFAVRFAWGYVAHDMSACYAMKGGFTPEEAGEWMDGREPMLIALWIAVSLIFWISVAAGIRCGAAMPHHASESVP